MTPSSDNVRHRLAAVWFADLVGYTRLSAEDEEAALGAVHDLQAAAREVVADHEGRIVKFVGDAALAEFASVHAAVRSALALGDAFARRFGAREDVSRDRASCDLRVGVHFGEVASTADGDLLGDGVNLASRLQGAADPGQVLVSEDVARQLGRRRDYRLENLGERSLKGVQRPVRLFAVGAPRASAGAASAGAAEVDALAAPKQAAASIAVLPFANLSPDPANEYFSDGVTEEILTTLARVGGLKVISRTSAMRYKSTSKSVRQIGEELGVATILEGSIRRAGDRVRIVAQLIDAGTDVHLWAERYDRDLDDIFAIQTDVAERIVEALQLHLSPGERARLAGPRTTSQDAYQEYLKGLWFWNRRTPEDLRRAESHFAEASDADRAYAPAHAGRACACVLQLHWGGHADPDARDRALAEAERALALDPSVGEAHAARAQVRIYDRDWRGAERDFRRAIELGPGDATSRQWYAEYLACMGRFDEAFAEIERARELDPLSLAILTEAGNIHFFARRYDEAERLYRQALDLDPSFQVTRFKLMEMYQALGRYDEALAELERVGRSQREAVAGIREAIARSGSLSAPGAYMETMLRFGEREGWPAYYYAAVLAAFGRNDEAFAVLERACSDRDWFLMRIAVSPHMDPLREEPRFERLLERLGLAHVRSAETTDAGPPPGATSPTS